MTAAAAAGPQTVNAWDIPLARRLFAFGVIAVSYLFYAYAWQAVDTLKPFFMQKWSLSRTEVSFFYGAQSVGAMVGAAAAAWAADRFGRVRVLSGITAGYALAMVAMPYCPGLWAQLADHLVLGFFVGGVFGTAAGIYVGLFPPQQRGRAASVLAVMFSLAAALQGLVGRWVLATDWRLVLIVGGAPALIAALLLPILVPDDRRITPFPSPAHPEHVPAGSAFRALFSTRYRTTTLKLVALSAVNFAGAETFSGWVTTYLKQLRYPLPTLGDFVTAYGVGGIVGVLGWGLVADRFGRRANAAGYGLAAVFIAVFLLTVRTHEAWALAAMFLYAVTMNASMIWGPMFAELYPVEMRSTAASIFHYGRIIAFLAPTAVAQASEVVGLGPAMSAAVAIYALGAVIWFSLPETLSLPARS